MGRSWTVVTLAMAATACGRLGFDASSTADGSVPADVTTNPGFCATATFPNPGTSSLADDFSGALTARWTPIDCITQGTGELVASPMATGDYCKARTLGDLHLTCDSIFMHVPEVTRATVGAQTYIYVYSLATGQSANTLLEGGGFQVITPDPAGTYDAVADAWWRLSERDGELIFDTAPDGIAWSEKGRAATPYSLDHVQIAIGAGIYKSVSSPGQARFRCFNVPPPCN